MSCRVDYGYGKDSGELREEGKKTLECQKVFIGQVGLGLNEFDMGGT